MAVIDTGINANHIMFTGKYDGNGMPVSSSGIGNYDVLLRDTNGNVISKNTHNDNMSAADNDPNFHGTHVAGIVASLIHTFDLEKYIKIMPIKASYKTLNKSQFTSTAFHSAINFALSNGADVVNMSIGGKGNAAFAVPYDKTKEAVFVAAAGNADDRDYGYNSDKNIKSFPGASDGVIGVVNYTESSSFDIGEAGKYALSGTSNYGSAYDIAAPGTAIWSVDGKNDIDYKPMNGTSMASPIVSFAAALLTLRYRAQSEATGFQPSPENIYNMLLSAPYGKVARRQRVRNLKTTESLEHPYGALELDSVAETDYLGNPEYSKSVAPLTFNVENNISTVQEQGRIKPITFKADVKPVNYPERYYHWYFIHSGVKTPVGTGKELIYSMPNVIGDYQMQFEIEGCLVKPEPVTLQVVPKLPTISEIKISVSNNVRDDGKIAVGTKVALKVNEIPYVDVDELSIKWYVNGELAAIGGKYIFSSIKPDTYIICAEYNGEIVLSKQLIVDETLNVNLLNFYSPYELFTLAAVGVALLATIIVITVAAVRKNHKRGN